MQGAIRERWQDLCQQATTEQDSKRLRALVDEIIVLLDEKQKRPSSHQGTEPPKQHDTKQPIKH